MPIAEVTNTAPQQASAVAGEQYNTGSPLLVCLPWVTADSLQNMRTRVATAFPERAALIAVAENSGAASQAQASDNIRMVDYPATSRGQVGWALTANDYLGASQLALEHGAAATLVLGAEAVSLSTEALQRLAEAVLRGEADLAIPRYTMGPQDALVSSALLYPLTRALFGISVHLPLPLDAAFSTRMAKRIAAINRPANTTASEPLLWTVAEAATTLLTVREIDAGKRTLPRPVDIDLNSLLTEVTGSLFSDIELKASFWQRARATVPAKPATQSVHSTAESGQLEDIREMAEAFRNAYTNLQDIWSLVLPPQSLLGLKKVSRVPAEDFEVPPDLWARTVYDFVLAYHLRTINRGHLLGALTPLYLAWVASHLRRSAGDDALAASHVEETAAAFVTEKPYIVARWRWPDRFNP